MLAQRGKQCLLHHHVYVPCNSKCCGSKLRREKCEAIQKQLSDRVAFPEGKKYSQSIESYFSLKEVDIHPSCVILPESADEVSQVIHTLSAGYHAWKEQCRFAIRGAGYVGLDLQNCNLF